MLRNRVNPYGEIIKTPERGAWLGNRGVLHNGNKEIVRPYKVKAWITCVLEFRGRYRKVMSPDRWTELFFLDEATAFSAGHRPCFQCRYKDHQRFKEFWLKGNPQYGFNMKTPISEIDDLIQKERINLDKSKVTYEEDPKSLPDCTFIEWDQKCYLLRRALLYQWSPGGYSASMPLPAIKKITVLTPRSFVNTFNAGYAPQTAV